MKLNQLLQHAGLQSVKWVEKKHNTGGIINWQMDAVIENRHVGKGFATSKARAKNMAAEEALRTLEAESPPVSTKPAAL